MIIVILHDAQSGQANLSFEGGDTQVVHDLLKQMTELMAQQLPKKSNLIIPPTVVPKDIMKRAGQP